MQLRDPAIDFVALAQALGVSACRVSEPRELGPALRAGFSSGAPNLVEVLVDDGFGN
jgi:thiamine pyrophosphate-dependent acetolactate synthase large subunit-like protein